MELVSICVKISRTIGAEKLSGAVVKTHCKDGSLSLQTSQTPLSGIPSSSTVASTSAAYFLPVVHRAYVSRVGSRVRSLRSKNRGFLIIGIEVFFSWLIMTQCAFLWLVNSSRRRIHIWYRWRDRSRVNAQQRLRFPHPTGEI